jgi:aminopeptidase
MGLKAGEKVLIVTDEAERIVGSSIQKCAEKVTGADNVDLFVLEDLVARPIKDLPDEIMSSILESNVTFWAADSLPGELETRHRFIELAKKYARHGHMPNITPVLMEQGMCSDYNEVYALTHKIHEVVRTVKRIHVSNRYGVEIDAEFDPNWRWVASDGRYHEKGRWGNLPEGETYTAPIKLSGRLVTNLLGDWFSEKYGNFNEPLSFMIEDSQIMLDTVQCSNGSLRSDLLQYLTTDSNSARASEFALPTNPELMSMPTIGNLLQDEKARVHIAFGDPYSEETGAPWSCPTHVDMLLEGCDLAADQIAIMKNGNYTV